MQTFDHDEARERLALAFDEVLAVLVVDARAFRVGNDARTLLQVRVDIGLRMNEDGSVARRQRIGQKCHGRAFQLE